MFFIHLKHGVSFWSFFSLCICQCQVMCTSVIPAVCIWPYHSLFSLHLTVSLSWLCTATAKYEVSCSQTIMAFCPFVVNWANLRYSPQWQHLLLVLVSHFSPASQCNTLPVFLLLLGFPCPNLWCISKWPPHITEF